MLERKMIAALKAGETLRIDDCATQEERNVINRLRRQREINMEFVAGKNGAWDVTWNSKK